MSINTLIQLGKVEKNNIEHKYKIINLTTGLELTKFMFENSFSINKFIKTGGDKISPNTAKITLDFKDITISRPLDLISPSFDFNNILVKDLIFKDDNFKNNAFNSTFYTSVDDVRVVDLVKNNDLIQITSTIQDIETIVFEGKCKTSTTTFKNTSISINLSLEANSFKLHEETWEEDTIYVNKFIANNDDKENSLIHSILMEAGYTYDQMDIQDVKLPSDEYIVLPFVSIESGEYFGQTLSDICKSFNGSYQDYENKVMVRGLGVPFDSKNIIADKNNILNQIVEESNSPEYNKVKVSFTKYIENDEEDIIWALIGTNGNLTNAQIKVESGTTSETQLIKWQIEWQPSGLVNYINPNYEIVVEDKDGNDASDFLSYDIETSSTTGTLKLYNSSDDWIYIKKFIIYGKAIKKIEDNYLEYTTSTDTPIVLEFSSDYVQSSAQAMYLAQMLYNDNCLDSKTISFDFNHCMDYMDIGDNILVRHDKYDDLDLIVTNMENNTSTCSIKAVTYGDFQYNDLPIPDTSSSALTYDDIKTNSVINETGVLNQEVPSKPTNLVLTPIINGFQLDLIIPSGINIKGFEVKIIDSLNSERFEFQTGVSQTYNGIGGSTYRVQVRTVTYADNKSLWTDLLSVKTNKLNTDDITYPTGQSPDELNNASNLLKIQLDEDILALQGVDAGLETKINTNISDIEINKDAITLEVSNRISKTDELTTNVETNASQIVLTNDAIALEILNRESNINELDSRIITNTASIGINTEAITLEVSNRELAINSLDSRVTKNTSDITINNDAIILKVNQDITSLRENEISSLQSSIDVNTEGILLEASSSIDVNTEGILLEASSRESQISDVNNPTNLLSQINIAPESIKLNSQLIQRGSGLAIEGDNVTVKNLSPEVIDFRDGDVIYKDPTTGVLEIKADQLNITASQVTLTDGTDLQTTVAKYEDGHITLNANTSFNGNVDTYGEDGITTYNNTTEALSTKKTIVKGGVIYFYERNSP